MKKKLLLLIFAFVAGNNAMSQGFLHRDGKKIVNGAGTEIILKGMGIGGWWLQEGYMLQTPQAAQFQIKNAITELVGADSCDAFYQRWRANFVTKRDVDSLAAWGFNSLRLPMHYNLLINKQLPVSFIETGFTMIDTLLNWCKANQIYLILDLHAAPGGQSHDNISDYDPSKLSLWEDVTNQTITIALWKQLATRYANETWIGGYDILNEPNWTFSKGNVPLRNLYIAITQAIREVDNNHILFIEGNYYATSFEDLTPAWDNNMAYSFHKYWNSNNVQAIQYLLDLRTTHNYPLWLGETGENSDTWFTECAQLLRSQGIGWSWWTLKKVEQIATPLNVSKTAEYTQILNYWKGTVPKPTVEVAMKGLNDICNNLKMENCVYQPDMLDALFRQVTDNSTRPFAENKIPGRIYAANYDFGRYNSAYYDKDYQNVTFNGVWNQGWIYRNDGVDVQTCADMGGLGYNVGWMENGEWMKYSVNVDSSGNYSVTFRVAGTGGGKIRLSIDDVNITPELYVTNTGDWQKWMSFKYSSVHLSAGKHTLKIMVSQAGYNLYYVDFEYLNSSIEKPYNSSSPITLYQNQPNPFSSQTSICIDLSCPQILSLDIYSVSGILVKTLATKEKCLSQTTYTWDGTDNQNCTVESGIYYYVLKCEGEIFTKKMVLSK